MKIKRNVLLIVLLLVLSFAGCGKEATPVVEESNVPSELVVEEQITEEVVTEEVMQEVREDKEVNPGEDYIPENYAYAITISINPLVTLYMDENDVTVGVTYDNDDAKDAYGEIILIGESFESNINTLIDAAIDKGYLKEEGSISFELSSVENTDIIKDDSILKVAEGIVNKHIEDIGFERETESKVVVEKVISEAVTEKTGIEKVEVTCVKCNGTGIYCPGDPNFGKSRGNGNGYAGCGGTGYAPCPDINCSGGTYKDPTCGGTGLQNCFGCKGSGTEDGNPCKHCGGSGKISCEPCGGKGTYPHHEFCMGTGTTECITKELHETCSECSGSGKVSD